MPDNVAASTITETTPAAKPEVKGTGKFMSAGKPEVFKGAPQATPGDDDVNKNIPEIGADGKPVTTTAKATNGAGANEKEKPPTFTDEQLKAYFETQGIKFEGIDKIKEKLNYEPPKVETPEEKTAAALAKEKKEVDIFVKGGGTIEQLVAIKQVANADLKELSRNTLRKELKDAKFTDKQVDDIIKERYYQLDEDELEQFADETEKEFLLRKKEYGSNKLDNRSQHTQKQAKEILAGLTAAADLEDTEATDEKALSSKIDEQFKTLPRKMTLELGEVNKIKLSPIDYDVAESDLKEVQDMLKDPTKRNNFFYNKDGGLNLTNIATVLTRNKMLESAVKKSYHEGVDRTVTEFQKTFPALTGYQLGVGGSSATKKPGTPGKMVGFGKPEIMNRNRQHN